MIIEKACFSGFSSRFSRINVPYHETMVAIVLISAAELDAGASVSG